MQARISGQVHNQPHGDKHKREHQRQQPCLRLINPIIPPSGPFRDFIREGPAKVTKNEDPNDTAHIDEAVDARAHEVGRGLEDRGRGVEHADVPAQGGGEGQEAEDRGGVQHEGPGTQEQVDVACVRVTAGPGAELLQEGQFGGGLGGGGDFGVRVVCGVFFAVLGVLGWGGVGGHGCDVVFSGVLGFGEEEED